MSVLKRVSAVSYDVRNWEQAKKFYGETLGLPVAFASDEYGWNEYGAEADAHVAISRWTKPEPIPHDGGAIALFQVDDVPQAVAELRKRGVKCDDAVGIPNVVTYATFYDPEGNRLQMAGPAPKA